MSTALSLDLRSRVLAAVAAGASHRAAAARFGVSAASVSRWRALQRTQGDPRPGPLGGDRRSGRVEAQGALIRGLLEESPDVTMESCVGGSTATATASATARSSGSSAGEPLRAIGPSDNGERITRKKDRPRERAGSPRHP